jgi:hypothetical protein
MKMYSDNAVSSADLETVKAQTLLAVDTVDAKQNRQIADLKTWLIVSFLVNVALTIALKFL